MGNKGRWEYLQAIYERYRKAGRREKKVILNEFCANTGYRRKYAIRLLNGPRPERRRPEARRFPAAAFPDGRHFLFGQRRLFMVLEPR